ncbi:uncharacterized protein SPSK_05691 [Sporothrix schenckii 1099-18]|uniref:Uncharacterized protein n=1 Tax=Sporothrix schenckii 1099-18 TaxID=1397361 RepID=A0A0F2LUA9_SPOSC|nr:uncharacterized protein SPSK_05691 [Sporothrix schenckii 1099-18]KJR81052.1 hypothetical protein SPSK_05691 [Sporothrix schenckii 1099-18]
MLLLWVGLSGRGGSILLTKSYTRTNEKDRNGAVAEKGDEMVKLAEQREHKRTQKEEAEKGGQGESIGTPGRVVQERGAVHARPARSEMAVERAGTTATNNGGLAEAVKEGRS